MPNRATLTRIVVAIAKLCVAAMLLYGGLEDAVEVAALGLDADAGRFGPFAGSQDLLGQWEILVLLLDALVSLGLAVVGLLMLERSRRDRGLLPGAVLVAVAVVDEILVGPDVLVDVYFGSYWALFCTAFLLFGSSFPRRLTSESLGLATRRSAVPWLDRALLKPVVVWPLAGVSAVLFTVFVRPALLDPSAGGGAPALLASIVGGTINVVFLWYGARYMRAGLRLADEADRHRMEWFVEACAVYVTGNLVLTGAWTVARRLIPLSPDWIDLVASVLYELLCVAAVFFLVLAVFYRGAFDPRIALKKTTIYGLLIAFTLFAFALLEGIVGDALVSLAGLPEGWTGWVTGALVALTLHPLHEALRRRVDGWLGQEPGPVAPQAGA